MTKLDTIKTTIKWGNLSKAELDELQRWLVAEFDIEPNKPTRIAVYRLSEPSKRVQAIIKTAEDAADLLQAVFDDGYVSSDIEKMCADWCVELIDWDYVFKQVKKNEN